MIAVAVCSRFAISRSVSAKASAPTSSIRSAIRGLGAFCVALAIIAALWRAAKTDCGSEEVLGPRVSGPRDWYGILRILLVDGCCCHHRRRRRGA